MNVVKVEMYICIANNKILLKFNLVDRFSFPCLKCLSFFNRINFILKKKKRWEEGRSFQPLLGQDRFI